MADNLAFREKKKKKRAEYKKTGQYTSALTGQPVGYGSAEGSVRRETRLKREKAARLAGKKGKIPQGRFEVAKAKERRRAGAAGDLTGGGMSAGFKEKFQEAQKEPTPIQEPQQIAPIQEPQKEVADVKFGTKEWALKKAGEWARFTNPVISTTGETLGLLDERTLKDEFQTALEMGGTVLAAGVIVKAGALLIPKLFGAGGMFGPPVKELMYGEQLLTPTVGSAKLLATKGAAGIGGAGVGTGVGSNALTYGIIGVIIVEAGALVGTAVLAASSIVFGQFQVNEAMDKLGIAEKRAMDEGAEDMAEEIRNYKDALVDIASSRAANFPLIGAWLGTKENLKGVVIANKANRYLAERRKQGLDKWSVIKKDEAEQKISDAEFYKQQTIELQEIKAEMQMEEFLKRMELLAEAEAERRAYNEAYWASVEEQKAENVPSNLKFGLL